MDTTAILMGANILGSLLGLLGPKQNIQQATSTVTNILTQTFTNEVNALIASNTTLQNYNSNSAVFAADGNCSINIRNFTQSINSVAGINKVLDQQTYTRFIQETMAKFNNNLETRITSSGSSLDKIFTAVAQLLGYQSQQQVRTEIVQQFSSVVRNLYSSNLQTDTRITVIGKNTVQFSCLGNSSINVDGNFMQSIVANSIVSERIVQVNQGVATSKLVLDVYNKARTEISESSWWTWIIVGIIIFIIILGIVGLIFWFRPSGTTVVTVPASAPVTAPVSNGGMNLSQVADLVKLAKK